MVLKYAKLREVRKEKGLTLKDISSKVGISHQALVNIETGKNGVSIPVLNAICEQLNLNPKTLEPEQRELKLKFQFEGRIIGIAEYAAGSAVQSDGISVEWTISKASGLNAEFCEVHSDITMLAGICLGRGIKQKSIEVGIENKGTMKILKLRNRKEQFREIT